MSGEINRPREARFYNRAMTNEEIQQRYRATVRRGRIFVFLVCPLVLGLVILVRPASVALGIEVGGTTVLVLWLIACAALAVIGVRLGRCPACGRYIGSRPIQQWGTPRTCPHCKVLLG